MSTLELENIKHPDNSGNNIALASNGTMTVDRKSSDGDIVNYRKDGTTVGAIGTLGGDLVIHSSESGHKGLRFGNGAIVPMANSHSGGSDANCNLGGATSRFNELYLSGGVFLGGTGTANKLDDYEEGTFTLAMVGYYGNPSTAVNIASKYTKVGNRVHISCEKTGINNTGAAGNMWFTGLPFTTVGSHIGACTLGGIGTYPSSSPFPIISGNIVYIYKHLNQGVDTAVFHNVVTSGSITITGTYLVS